MGRTSQLLQAESDKMHRESDSNVRFTLTDLHGKPYLKISHVDRLRPFFMSLVSNTNHWMFIASNGGLTAGRKNANNALFPYYTDDKIIESAEHTGSKTLLRIQDGQKSYLWEPFSDRNNTGLQISRNLYKSPLGNSIVFEEICPDLDLTFRYSWSFSHSYGFVRISELLNTGYKNYKTFLLDGVQNLLPYGVGQELQQAASNLVDAYKRAELDAASGLAIFALSAIIVDKAEPSEALKATGVWSFGLENPHILLSSNQLDDFRKNKEIYTEHEIKGERGAYFIAAPLDLDAGSMKEWGLIADVCQQHSQLVSIKESLRKKQELLDKVLLEISQASNEVKALIASADGLRYSADWRHDTRHFANVMFNVMRGGIFDCNYEIDLHDYLSYLNKAHIGLVDRHEVFTRHLSNHLYYDKLLSWAKQTNDVDLIRLTTEYLPLRFSRRHGDPSRPWNRFSINTHNDIDGKKILDYEGNWRDIFQNWEALAMSYPAFLEGMLFKFMNASTFDGYNPYRITKGGFDWETIEPDDPWSYIGYWGDHQIIYLLKFLEHLENFFPGKWQEYADKDWFVYAAVPYVIKPYDQLIANPKETIDFDVEWDKSIRERRLQMGSDGALWHTEAEPIYHVNLIEKLMATLLAKISNLIPGAGIWMNTQRPEWNDANNALVGNGVSMVTLCYLHRFMLFFRNLLESSNQTHYRISGELLEFYHSVRDALIEKQYLTNEKQDAQEARILMDSIGRAASEYREQIYRRGFWGKKRTISLQGLKSFADTVLAFTEQAICSNKRTDGIYHAYNIVKFTQDAYDVDHLSEMLEGQVAALSSGAISSHEALHLLDTLEKSALYRKDQESYMLYPNKILPGFFEKNSLSPDDVEQIGLLGKLIHDGNKQILEQDCLGMIHFNGDFRNDKDLDKALNALPAKYHVELLRDRPAILALFEQVFQHRFFTGRSGTFFAYEGLGSIYWHMVSKLLLATQECCIRAYKSGENSHVLDQLCKHYYAIQKGLGIHKSPVVYGAFPTDPYSHTPAHRGAQQPGMTGQVKEDILIHFGELGICISDGQLSFDPFLLQTNQLLDNARQVSYVDVSGENKTMMLESNSLMFTYCQVPILYSLSRNEGMEINLTNGEIIECDHIKLSKELSHEIFYRTGLITRIQVFLDMTRFRKTDSKV